MFKRVTLSKTDVRKELNKNFIFVMIDLDKDVDKIADSFRVGSIPATFCLYKKARRVEYTGSAQEHNKFLKWLKAFKK